MEQVILNNVKKFLPHLAGKEDQLDVNNLPLLYRGLFRFSKVTINQVPYLGINLKDSAIDFGPREFKKHGKFLEEKMGLPVIWSLKEMHPHKVERLIANGVNFIVQGKQVHLPILSISLKNEIKTLKVGGGSISPLGINILIREILKADISGLNKIELAQEFETTKMTMGRVLEPLIVNGLCEEEKIGVSKIIKFKDKNFLWDYIKKNISTPVKSIVYSKRIDKKLPLSGVSALAMKSMLAEDEVRTFVVSKKNFNKHFKVADLTVEGLGVAKLEIWDREPSLVKDGIINPVDLYLVLKNDSDERVQIELEKILKEEKLNL
jgi:hypothetical protein